MSYKKVILFVVAVIIINILYNVPSYKDWFNTKIYNDNVSISEQSENLDVDYRMMYKFGNTYAIYQGVLRRLREVNDTAAIVLLPPIPYVAKMGAEQGFSMTEPDIFYYHTGIKGDMCNSPDVEQSKYALVVENHHMALRRIESKQYLDSLIALYKPYY